MVAEQLRTQCDEYTAMRTATSNLADRYQEALVEADPTAYIHLKDARAFPTAGYAGMPNNGMHWRGQLSEVSGWSFGLLAEGP